MIATSTSIGLYTAMKELRHAPDVHLKKSRRETIPEVVEPEHVIDESDKFIKKSLFRRLGHIQDPNAEIFFRYTYTYMYTNSLSKLKLFEKFDFPAVDFIVIAGSQRQKH